MEEKQAICPDCGERKNLAWDCDIVYDRIKCRCLTCHPLRVGTVFPEKQKGELRSVIRIVFYDIKSGEWIPSAEDKQEQKKAISTMSDNTVIPGAFNDPNYKIHIQSVEHDNICDFCNRKNTTAATIWWMQPEVKPPASFHTFMVICIDCIETIHKAMKEACPE